MDDAKAQLTDRLKTANNVLVTVSRDPSVDQLAALLGLTLFLNKQGKHAAAVFSGQVPSTIEFLKPEETIEKNTDSLQDFIIALDKSKADKLRYKVEDNVVRIFITPYKTSISQDDLEFSQGDFNVDVVIALGVQQQADLDEAITAHGRILHDATIATLNLSGEGDLGSINWQGTPASSLSEMVTELISALDGSLVDNQIATALLTGIVSETDRFSNDKTTAQTMGISAMLMEAGANQQLVASQLEESGGSSNGLATKPADEKSDDDGTIEIDHVDEEKPAEPAEPLPPSETSVEPTDQSATTELTGTANKRITEPPALGGTLTANSEPEDDDAPSVNPMGIPTSEPPLLQREPGVPVDTTVPTAAPPAPTGPEPVIPGLTPPPPAWVPPTENPLGSAPVTTSNETLTQIEQSVDSPHLSPTSPDLGDARDEVNQAVAGAPNAAGAYAPAEALNAQPLGGSLHDPAAIPEPLAAPVPAESTNPSGLTNIEDLLNQDATTPNGSTPPTPSDSSAPPVPPPIVPPPIPFEFNGNNTPPAQ